MFALRASLPRLMARGHQPAAESALVVARGHGCAGTAIARLANGVKTAADKLTLAVSCGGAMTQAGSPPAPRVDADPTRSLGVVSLNLRATPGPPGRVLMALVSLTRRNGRWAPTAGSSKPREEIVHPRLTRSRCQWRTRTFLKDKGRPPHGTGGCGGTTLVVVICLIPSVSKRCRADAVGMRRRSGWSLFASGEQAGAHARPHGELGPA